MPWAFSGIFRWQSDATGTPTGNGGAPVIFAHRNLTLFQEGKLPAPVFIGTYGCVFGYLFDRQAADARVLRFDPDEVERIISSNGQHLLTRYWGAYVAIWQEPTREALTCLRDPSGMIPCYLIRRSDCVFFASDAGAFRNLTPRPRPDWAGLRRFLYAHELKSRQTALQDVAEVLPGERIRCDETQSKAEMAWTPWHFTRRHINAAPEALADAVAAEVDRVVKAWRSAVRRPVLSLSGGLDSSVLAASLARTGLGWSALNMAYADAGSDERDYAGEVAAAFEVPLFRATHCLSDVNSAVAKSGHLPRPLGHAFGQSQSKTRQAYLDAEGADALFVGEGGDNVFAYMQSATPVVDRYLIEGPRGAWQTVLDISDMTRTSVWTVMRLAAARWQRHDPRYVWTGDASLLSPATEASLATLPLSHPWLEAPPGALPGEATHISMLLRIQGTLDAGPARHRPTIIAPLLSQPLLELCLGIPSWRWCQGGINRSLVRRGFAGRLPQRVLWRVSKGGANVFCMDVIERDRATLCAHLCDGRLAHAGLLDVRRIKVVLTSKAPIPSPLHLRISQLAEAEAWVRHWEVN